MFNLTRATFVFVPKLQGRRVTRPAHPPSETESLYSAFSMRSEVRPLLLQSSPTPQTDRGKFLSLFDKLLRTARHTQTLGPCHGAMRCTSRCLRADQDLYPD
jgi:hypothetical protein